MSCVSSINGIDLEEFKSSYTLTFLIERCLKDYYKLSSEEKISLFNEFDKEISDKLNMPRANFVFEKKEFTLDTKNIYFGNLKDLKSGYEFISRYFFEKRQQYQRMCVVSRDKKNFSEREFEDIKCAYEELPLTKKNNYVSYNKGLEKYLTNYNKMDAIMYMFDCSVACLKMTDYQRILMGMNAIERNKLIFSLDRCEQFSDKFSKIMEELEKSDRLQETLLNNYEDFKLSMIKESYFITDLAFSIVMNQPQYNESVLLCFHENVWENLPEDTKKMCIEIANELIAKKLRCSSEKVVCYTRGSNSYNFSNHNNFYIGDISKYSAREILFKLVYEYSFVKVYEESVRCNDEYMLNEYKICKNKYENSRTYRDILDSEYIRHVRQVALDAQSSIYDYINKNLIMDGKKIGMTMKKKDFIMDLFNPKKSRR